MLTALRGAIEMLTSKLTRVKEEKVFASRDSEAVYLAHVSSFGGLFAGHGPVSKCDSKINAEVLSRALLETLKHSRKRDRRPFKNRMGWNELNSEIKREYGVASLSEFYGDERMVTVSRERSRDSFVVTALVPKKGGGRGSMSEARKETLANPSAKALGVAVLKALDELDKARER